jgi:hypothetical protein
MKILDRVPISEQRTSLQFGDKYVTVRRNQILVWVSVHLAGALEPEKNIPQFPALLDTGNNFAFSLQDRLLRDWAGIDPSLLVSLGNVEINGQAVTCRTATVWLYSNSPGRQEVASDRPPFLLEMGKGIAVYPPDAVPPGPRLPLLGLPALLDNDLDWWLDPEQQNITVQSRTWRRHLGCEIDRRHFDTACERIERAYREPAMFTMPVAPKPEQTALFLAA